MEGAVFYWILWLLWAYLTFILNKQHPYRCKLSATFLIVIILANFHFQIGRFDLYTGGLFLLFVSYSVLVKSNKRTAFYFFVCSTIVMLAYAAFLLFEIFDPVFLILKREWMMGICLSYIVCLLQKTLTGRLWSLISGTMQGEILYALILSKFDFSYPIGSLSYLDTWALTTILLIGWSFFESTGAFIGGYFHFTPRSRQKSS